MKALKPFLFVVSVIFFTIVTQIGGLVLLLSIPLFRFVNRKTKNQLKRRVFKSTAFLGLYLVITIAIVPSISKPFGRVPLPVFSSDHLKPLNIMTCLLNRHYVKPELLQTIEAVSDKLDQKHPGTVVSYLDANFSFINGFPLIPHLSHNDGKKLDLAFFYLDNKTKKPLRNQAPSFIGYGVFEGPRDGEIDQPSACKRKGFWQYSFMENLIPQWNKDEMLFDQERTGDLITLLANESSVGKLFIEPHLKQRMGLLHDKIRFHGCQAVRHDDHIHVQLK